MAYIDFLPNMGRAFLIFGFNIFVQMYLVLIVMPHEWHVHWLWLIALKYLQINLAQCL